MEQSCTVFYMPISHKLAGAGVKYEKGRGQQAVLALKVFFSRTLASKKKTNEKLASQVGARGHAPNWGGRGRGDPACCAVQENLYYTGETVQTLSFTIAGCLTKSRMQTKR